MLLLCWARWVQQHQCMHGQQQRAASSWLLQVHYVSRDGVITAAWCVVCMYRCCLLLLPLASWCGGSRSRSG